MTTPDGLIKARKIIYATNGYTSHLLPEYARCIVPIRGIACHISSPKGTDTPHLVNTYGIRFDARNNDYLIPRPDGSIIVGGARQRFWHNKERWYGTIRDDELIEEAVSYFDDYMQRHFRCWENSGAKAESIWTGSKLELLQLPTAANTSTSHGLQRRFYASRWRGPRQARSVHHCWFHGPWDATDSAFEQRHGGHGA